MAQAKYDHFSTSHHVRKPKAKEPTRRCHMCMGTGMAPCPICLGKGEVVNGRDSNGRVRFVACVACYGKKMLRCRLCNGTGMI